MRSGNRQEFSLETYKNILPRKYPRPQPSAAQNAASERFRGDVEHRDDANVEYEERMSEKDVRHRRFVV